MRIGPLVLLLKIELLVLLVEKLLLLGINLWKLILLDSLLQSKIREKMTENYNNKIKSWIQI